MKLRRNLKFLDYAPVLHISALTGERTGKLLETIDAVAASRRRRVPTAELNRFLEAVTAAHPPASPGKKEVRILYGAQTGIEPPTFVMFTNVATRVSLLLPAIPGQPPARGVRVRGNAHPHPRARVAPGA